MNMKTIFLAILTATLFLPSVFAFNCELVQDQDSCYYVQNNSNLTQAEKDYLFADLLYLNTSFPNHDFVKEYNDNIVVSSPPIDTVLFSDGFIQDAWIEILSISPSVLFNDSMLVPDNVVVGSKSDYVLNIPDDYHSLGYPSKSGADCRRTYNLISESSSLTTFVDSVFQGSGETVSCSITDDASITSRLIVSSLVDIRHYEWNSYCCRHDADGNCIRHCHDCNYAYTETIENNLVISDSQDVKLSSEVPEIDFRIINQYSGTTKGVFNASKYSTFRINFNNSFIQRQLFDYRINFSQYPYYFATLEKESNVRNTQDNIFFSDNTFWVSDASNCKLTAYNDFSSIEKPCNMTLVQEVIPEYAPIPETINIGLFLKLFAFGLAVYLIYWLLKQGKGKKILPILLGVMFIPGVHADCGLTNLAECIPETIYNYFISIINAPLQPLLYLIKTLLEAPAPAELFLSIWTIIVYVLSLFYAFLFIYIGTKFMISGTSPFKRYLAKEWLKNTVLMIVFIQMSFYLYGLVVELSAVMSSAVLHLVNEEFFLLTANNLSNIGLEFLFSTFYAIILFITVIFLTIRFLAVAFGVIFLPIGIFCYFIPPLRSYGSFILNVLGILIFITFIDVIIILACSWLVQISIFESIKILVMICCFLIIDYLMIKLIIFVIGKSTFEAGKEQLTQAVKYIAMAAA